MEVLTVGTLHDNRDRVKIITATPPSRPAQSTPALYLPTALRLSPRPLAQPLGPSHSVPVTIPIVLAIASAASASPAPAWPRPRQLVLVLLPPGRLRQLLLVLQPAVLRLGAGLGSQGRRGQGWAGGGRGN